MKNLSVFPLVTSCIVCFMVLACSSTTTTKPSSSNADYVKPVVYQVFTRLFGNTNTTNMPWGSIEQNGVGKFADFTPTALNEIRNLGVTHVWYTGVPHHAVIKDYTEFGISNDDPDVVKGRAGSPYAVKDYYNVNPDLASDPANRLVEFEALIARTHQAGMKVIIDIVPNHIARNYQSLNKPEGIEDFGESDDTSVVYAKNNNFYYVVGEDFEVPVSQNGYLPLGGESHPLSDGLFKESPAKWTGNGSRLAQPNSNDWYETVKINYGVSPDGQYDFDKLPESYRNSNHQVHHDFWQDKHVPDSWKKFEHIVHYWLDKGVDGFRYDMAEMVPVEFWSFLNSSIKVKNPQAFILAEVYNPDLYRDYIQLGKMDYLYDKVEFYDSLKLVMQNKTGTDELELIQHRLADIAPNMLHFLENHDEQRIASPEFAGDPIWGLPAMVVSSLISQSPTMLYFGQEVGEDGSETAGFGTPSRTSIFDYVGVPAHQRWMNEGKFDGAQLSVEEQQLRDYYQKILTISSSHPTMLGKYASLHSANRWNESSYNSTQFSFVRWHNANRLFVISSFDDKNTVSYKLNIPANIIQDMKLSNGAFRLVDLLSGKNNSLSVNDQEGTIDIVLPPRTSLVYEVIND